MRGKVQRMPKPRDVETSAKRQVYETSLSRMIFDLEHSAFIHEKK